MSTTDSTDTTDTTDTIDTIEADQTSAHLNKLGKKFVSMCVKSDNERDDWPLDFGDANPNEVMKLGLACMDLTRVVLSGGAPAPEHAWILWSLHPFRSVLETRAFHYMRDIEAKPTPPTATLAVRRALLSHASSNPFDDAKRATLEAARCMVSAVKSYDATNGIPEKEWDDAWSALHASMLPFPLYEALALVGEEWVAWRALCQMRTLCQIDGDLDVARDVAVEALDVFAKRPNAMATVNWVIREVSAMEEESIIEKYRTINGVSVPVYRNVDLRDVHFVNSFEGWTSVLFDAETIGRLKELWVAMLDPLIFKSGLFGPMASVYGRSHGGWQAITLSAWLQSALKDVVRQDFRHVPERLDYKERPVPKVEKPAPPKTTRGDIFKKLTATLRLFLPLASILRPGTKVSLACAGVLRDLATLHAFLETCQDDMDVKGFAGDRYPLYAEEVNGAANHRDTAHVEHKEVVKTLVDYRSTPVHPQVVINMYPVTYLHMLFKPHAPEKPEQVALSMMRLLGRHCGSPLLDNVSTARIPHSTAKQEKLPPKAKKTRNSKRISHSITLSSEMQFQLLFDSAAFACRHMIPEVDKLVRGKRSAPSEDSDSSKIELWKRPCWPRKSDCGPTM